MVDVNENDQTIKRISPKRKRVTFVPDIVVEHVDVEQTPSDSSSFPSALNADHKDMLKLSLTELWLSHSALLLILLAAVIFYRCLSLDQ